MLVLCRIIIGIAAAAAPRRPLLFTAIRSAKPVKADPLRYYIHKSDKEMVKFISCEQKCCSLILFSHIL